MEDITKLDNRLSIEKSVPGRRALKFKGRLKHSAAPIPETLRRKTAPRLAELSEFDVVRHFTRLSKINFSIDSHFYPLGSCTMKYNPRLNEDIAVLDGFAGLHPMAPDEAAQGTLECLYNLQNLLCELCGMEAITLQPAAGAHSEFTGLMAAKAYFAHKNQSSGGGETATAVSPQLLGKGVPKASGPQNGQKDRVEIIVPDSAHGTNPASAAMLGFSPVNINSGPDGRVDLEVLKQHLGPKTAVVMLTIPNTLGIFESGIETISKTVHEAGALVYLDGANFNAMIGMIKPGELGVDIMHLNMHKTFSTPHGGGGPGAGAIAVKKYLDAYLPVPVIKKEGNRYGADFNRPLSIGKVKAFFGNTGVLLKAYAYLLMHSSRELAEISENAIINANYAKALLKDYFPSHSKDHCMHECVLAPSPEMLAKGIRTLDVAKRLLDYGFHAPTIYFPHIAHEAIMIEPTETETRETVEEFAAAMKKISAEALSDPLKLKDAPHTMPVKRLDEVQAARQPNLRW